MAEDAPGRRPLLNPILRFVKEPKPEGVTGRSKTLDSIKTDRLAGQRRKLSSQLATMADEAFLRPRFGSRVLIYARMFDDSLAMTWTPSDLFRPDHGARLIAPFEDGYLVEIHASRLAWLAAFVISADRVRDEVDISRVESVRFHEAADVLGGRTTRELWEAASEGASGRAFMIWFTPFSDLHATEAILVRLGELRDEALLQPPAQRLLTAPGPAAVTIGDASIDSFQRELLARDRGDRFNGALRDYRQTRRARTTVLMGTPEALEQLAASGAVVRIEPVKPLTVTSPGEGVEPDRPLPRLLAEMPIVGIVDGGLNAPSYLAAEAWRTRPPLVADVEAELKHGNRVTSLVVQGHDWNNNLSLPPLYCRVGTVQAIARTRRGGADPETLVDYVDAAMASHPETRVWNLSINQPVDCSVQKVSYLGHAFAELARKHDVLLVNSIGNKPGDWLQPPADCEAALTIGGRLNTDDGKPGGRCPVSHSGPGPSSLLKPDISHFSRVRAIGGAIEVGSSFATALAAPLAAHTMHRLREPTPDLVKALLIHRADGDGYDSSFGFGSPDDEFMPWECEPGAVTLHWSKSLRPGAYYYWELPIPPGLLIDGRLRGRGRLTAVLNPHPLVSDFGGPNYFSARMATGVMFQRGEKFHNLLGSMEAERTAEQEARAVDHKWCPVRHHSHDFSRRGFAIDDHTLRIYGRVFTRDLYLYGYNSPQEVPSLDAVFVLSFAPARPTGDLYDQFRDVLGPFVEPSVIETDVGLDLS